MGSIDHAVLTPALEKGKMSYSRGSEVRIACSDGYRVLGAKVVKCKEDGSWSHSSTCAGSLEAKYAPALHALSRIEHCDAQSIYAGLAGEC